MAGTLPWGVAPHGRARHKEAPSCPRAQGSIWALGPPVWALGLPIWALGPPNIWSQCPILVSQCPILVSYWGSYWERYGGTAPTLLIVSSCVSCLTGAVVFAWDRSLLIVCSQDICCVCSQDICIVSSQDICIVSSQGICIEDICILSHLNATNHNIRAAQPRACRSFYH